MPQEIILPVSHQDDFYMADCPGRVRLVITNEHLEKILKVRKFLDKLSAFFPGPGGIYSIEVFDPFGVIWEDRFLDEKDRECWKESETRIECTPVVFTLSGFYVVGYIKHTNVRLESEMFEYAKFNFQTASIGSEKGQPMQIEEAARRLSDTITKLDEIRMDMNFEEPDSDGELAEISINLTDILPAISKPASVRIEVKGGVADITECPENVEVEIIDHD